jgi:acyl dehydratase
MGTPAASGEIDLGSWTLDAEFVGEYLGAVEDTSGLYGSLGVVPPMALAARALGGLMEALALPPGTVHASQEVEHRGMVVVGQEVSCVARLSRPRRHGDWSLVSAEFAVSNPGGEVVLVGKSTVLVPGERASGG